MPARRLYERSLYPGWSCFEMCCNYLKHNFTTLRCLHTKKSGFNVRRRETASERHTATSQHALSPGTHTKERGPGRIVTEDSEQSTVLFNLMVPFPARSVTAFTGSFLVCRKPISLLYLVYAKHDLSRSIARCLKTVEVFTTSTERGWNSISNNSQPRVVLDLGRDMMERERSLGGRGKETGVPPASAASPADPHLALSPDVASWLGS